MAGQLRPPIRLPGATWNRMIDDSVAAMVKRINLAAKGELELFPDGLLPGQVELQGRQKLGKYLAATTDLSDFALIGDPDYETRVRAGLDRPPGSQFWLQALSIPGMFTEMAKEFVGLMTRYET